MRHPLTWLLPTLLAAAIPAPAAELVVLRYGEVLPAPAPGAEAVATTALIEHLELLADRGYAPVDLEAVRAGAGALPERAYLLTFDGGYASFATEVAPLLAAAGIPSVLGVATGWLDGTTPPPDDRPRLDWDALRRLIAGPSPVAVASHGHDLWRMLPANSFGDRGPAATTMDQSVAEDEEARRDRLQRDLRHSADRLATELGQPVRVVAWPHGAWDRSALDAAHSAGFDLAMALRPTLDPGGDRGDGVLRRIAVTPGFDAAALEWSLHPPSPPSTVRRSVTVDLDWFAADVDNPTPRLEHLTARLAALGTTTVMLQLPALDPARSELHDVVELAGHLISRLRQESPLRPILVDLRAVAADPGNAVIESLLGRLKADGVVLPRPPTELERSSIVALLPDAIIVVPARTVAATSPQAAILFDVVLYESNAREPTQERPPALPPEVASALVLTRGRGDSPEDLARRLRRLSAAGWRWIGLDAELSRVLLNGPFHPASAELSELRRPREAGAR